MATLIFKAGRLTEYHGDGLHLRDGDRTGEISKELADRLLSDFPDMFSDAGSDTSDKASGGKTPETETVNLSKLNKPDLVDFAREQGVEIPDPDAVTKKQIIEILNEAQTAREG